MKTLKKLKAMIVAALLAAFVIAGVSKVSVAQFASQASPVKYQTEKSNIDQDIMAIKFQREYIQSLQKKLRADQKAGNEAAAIADRRKLIKARGELRMSIAYLKADKMDLISDHNLAIDARKDAIKKYRADLRLAQRNLDNNIASGNEDGIVKESLAVARYKKAIKANETALSREKVDRNADIVAVNKKIEKVNGAPVAALRAENTLAHTSNWIEK